MAIDVKNFKKHKPYPDKKKSLKEFMFRFPPPLKVVDVGTRSGYLSKKLLKNGYDVISTEIDYECVKWIKENRRDVNIVQDDFSSTSLPENSFDVVFSFHVIEHVPDPLKFLDSAWKILKKNGVIFTYFPLTKKKTDSVRGFMTHLTFYETLEEFRIKVIDKRDFEIVELSQTKIKGFNYRYSEGLFVGRKTV